VKNKQKCSVSGTKKEAIKFPPQKKMAKNDSTWKENWQRLALMEDQIMKEN